MTYANNQYMITSTLFITGSVKVSNIHSEISICGHTFGSSLERWVQVIKMKPIQYKTEMNPNRTNPRFAPQIEFKDITFYSFLNVNLIEALNHLCKTSNLGITCFVTASTIDNVLDVSEIVGIDQSYVKKVSLKFSTFFNIQENPTQAIVKTVITGAKIQHKHRPRGETQMPEGYLVTDLDLIDSKV